jgi:hypothetical protein
MLTIDAEEDEQSFIRFMETQSNLHHLDIVLEHFWSTYKSSLPAHVLPALSSMTVLQPSDLRYFIPSHAITEVSVAACWQFLSSFSSEPNV